MSPVVTISERQRTAHTRVRKRSFDEEKQEAIEKLELTKATAMVSCLTVRRRKLQWVAFRPFKADSSTVNRRHKLQTICTLLQINILFPFDRYCLAKAGDYNRRHIRHRCITGDRDTKRQSFKFVEVAYVLVSVVTFSDICIRVNGIIRHTVYI